MYMYKIYMYQPLTVGPAGKKSRSSLQETLYCVCKAVDG